MYAQQWQLKGGVGGDREGDRVGAVAGHD